jgi:hypothetical protein
MIIDERGWQKGSRQIVEWGTYTRYTKFLVKVKEKKNPPVDSGKIIQVH